MLEANGGELMNNDFKGPGFDWNGNGKKDGFDVFMDIKSVEDANKCSKSYSNSNVSKNSYKTSSTQNDTSWGQVGVIWLAVAVIFFAFFLVFTVFEDFPLISSAICFGAIFLAIKIINGK